MYTRSDTRLIVIMLNSIDAAGAGEVELSLDFGGEEREGQVVEHDLVSGTAIVALGPVTRCIKSVLGVDDGGHLYGRLAGDLVCVHTPPECALVGGEVGRVG